MRLPDMERQRNQAVVSLLAVLLAAPVVGYLSTRPINSAEANWVPPLLTTVTCTYRTQKDEVRTKVFYEHPTIVTQDDLDRWMSETGRVSEWSTRHDPLKCKYTHLR